MITKDQEINIANELILEKNKSAKRAYFMQLDKTVEFELGWVFFYQTKDYIESGNLLSAAGENAPIIIDKRTGAIHVTGTVYPVNKYIVDFLSRKGKRKSHRIKG